ELRAAALPVTGIAAQREAEEIGIVHAGSPVEGEQHAAWARVRLDDHLSVPCAHEPSMVALLYDNRVIRRALLGYSANGCLTGAAGPPPETLADLMNIIHCASGSLTCAPNAIISQGASLRSMWRQAAPPIERGWRRTSGTIGPRSLYGNPI